MKTFYKLKDVTYQNVLEELSFTYGQQYFKNIFTLIKELVRSGITVTTQRSYVLRDMLSDGLDLDGDIAHVTGFMISCRKPNHMFVRSLTIWEIVKSGILSDEPVELCSNVTSAKDYSFNIRKDLFELEFQFHTPDEVLNYSSFHEDFKISDTSIDLLSKYVLHDCNFIYNRAEPRDLMWNQNLAQRYL